MTKTLICDCWDNTERLYSGEPLVQGTKKGYDMIELDNGIWLENCYDGRFFNTDNDSDCWATVQEIEFNEDGEIVQERDFLGYTQV